MESMLCVDDIFKPVETMAYVKEDYCTQKVEISESKKSKRKQKPGVNPECFWGRQDKNLFSMKEFNKKIVKKYDIWRKSGKFNYLKF